MKMFLFGLFLIPALCFAQKKGDTKILVHTDTVGLFNKLVETIYKRGLAPDYKDDKMIVTRKKTIKGFSNVYMVITAYVISGEVTITGGIYFFKDIDSVPAQFKGAPKSMLMMTWNEMKAIAEELGGEITYSR
jgi:hypothetical protein